MVWKSILYLLISMIAGYTGYYAYTQSGLLSGIIVLLAVMWLLYRLSSGERTWKTFGLLINPPTAALLFFLVSFTFTSLQSNSFNYSMVFGISAALIGLVSGMFLHKYWTIGD